MRNVNELKRTIEQYKQSDNATIKGAFEAASEAYFEKALENPTAAQALLNVINTLSVTFFENKANLSSLWQLRDAIKEFTNNQNFDFSIQGGDDFMDLMLCMLHMLHQAQPESKLFDNIEHIYVYYESLMDGFDQYYFSSLLSLQFILKQMNQETTYKQCDQLTQTYNENYENLDQTTKTVVDHFIQNKLFAITKKVHRLSEIKNPSTMVLHELSVAKKQAQVCHQVFDKIAEHLTRNEPEKIAKNMATWLARVEHINNKTIVQTNRSQVHNQIMRKLSPYERQFNSLKAHRYAYLGYLQDSVNKHHKGTMDDVTFHIQAKRATQDIKAHLKPWQLLKRFRVWRFERYLKTTFKKQIHFADAKKNFIHAGKPSSTHNALTLLSMKKTEQCGDTKIADKISKLSDKLHKHPELQTNPAMFFKAESLRRRAEAEGIVFEPPAIGHCI